MIDYLLEFPDRDTAIAFGVLQGYTTIDEEADKVSTRTATHDYYIHIIGGNLVPTGEVHVSPFGDIPLKESDGKHWIRFRDINGTMPVPQEAEQYIAWQSDSGEDRPENAPEMVFA